MSLLSNAFTNGSQFTSLSSAPQNLMFKTINYTHLTRGLNSTTARKQPRKIIKNDQQLKKKGDATTMVDSPQMQEVMDLAAKVI